MGACRQTQNLIFYIKRNNWKEFWYFIKHFNKITFEDTFMPLICKLFGHKVIICDLIGDNSKVEYTCKRCHRYVNYKPKVYNNLSIDISILILYIEQETNKKIKITQENNYIELLWKQVSFDSINHGIKRDISNYLSIHSKKFK